MKEENTKIKIGDTTAHIKTQEAYCVMRGLYLINSTLTIVLSVDDCILSEDKEHLEAVKQKLKDRLINHIKNIGAEGNEQS